MAERFEPGSLFAAGAALSIVLAVVVRLRTADFTEVSSHYIAARLDEPDEVVAVCGIQRTVVSPAPIGSFGFHELIYDWSAPAALQYYTGESATFLLRAPHSPCPSSPDADVVFQFEQLRVVAGLSD